MNEIMSLPAGRMDSIIALGNKKPVWNEETQSYVLNFNGRVTQVQQISMEWITSRFES